MLDIVGADVLDLAEVIERSADFVGKSDGRETGDRAILEAYLSLC